MTLLPHTSGTARVCRHDVVRDLTSVRRVIGHVPQTPSWTDLKPITRSVAVKAMLALRKPELAPTPQR